MVLTKDDRIRYRVAERTALVSAKVMAFVLGRSGGNVGDANRRATRIRALLLGHAAKRDQITKRSACCFDYLETKAFKSFKACLESIQKFSRYALLTV